MLDMWLACYTQQEIAEVVGVTAETVSTFLQKNQNLEAFPKSEKSAILHDDGFEPQIYSIWSFPKATNEVRHFGNAGILSHQYLYQGGILMNTSKTERKQILPTPTREQIESSITFKLFVIGLQRLQEQEHDTQEKDRRTDKSEE